VTVLAVGDTPWPGITPDATMLVYGDTARAGVFIVSDLNGRRLDSLSIPSAQLMQSWTGAATLLTSASGDVRRLGAVELASAEARTLFETADFSQEPVWAPDGRAVAFLRSASDGCYLSTRASDGSAPRDVKLPDGGCAFPALAADQRTLVFRHVRDTGSPMLTAVDMTTGRATELQDLAGSGTRWTLDSLLVVVVELADTSSLNRVATIWHVSLAGERTRAYQLSLDPNTIVFPVDRSRVLLSRTTPRDFRLLNLADGAERVVLPPQTGFVAVDPSISPDRRWAAFRINPNGADNRTMNLLELVQLDGSERHTLQLPFSAEAGRNNPTIVLGGKGVVVVERRQPEQASGIFLVDVETRAVTRLMDAAPVGRIPEIVTSPDGGSLLFLVTTVLPTRVSAWDFSPLRPAIRP
jgi:Tol biopolymer transport system component